MKLKDFKKLNEGWNKWRLAEEKLQYSVANTGYGEVIRFFDETGEEQEWSLGSMVLDLVDAGVGGWAPEEEIDRMMAVNADPNKNQGGMHKWDSSVFEDYYGADNQKILQAWGKMNNMELEQVPDPDAEEEYEDDGEYDFESYYSESKKRNKVHELFGMGKKKMNPDGTECKGCKGLKWAQNDVEIQGWQDRYAKSGQWFKKRREDPKFAEPRMPDDEHYMRGWKRGEQDADDEAKYAHVGLEERIKKTVARKLREKRKLSETVSSYEEIMKIRDSGDYGAQDMASEAINLMQSMQQIPAEDAIQITLDALDADGRDDESFWHNLLSPGGNLMDALEGLKQTADDEYQPDSVEEAVSPEQQEANEKAYSRCFEMGRKGVDVKTALRGGPVADFAACRAGHEDGANEFRQSLPSEHDLQERIKKAVIRKLRERKK